MLRSNSLHSSVTTLWTLLKFFSYTLLVLFEMNLRRSVSHSKFLKHGQICDPEEDGVGGRYGSCGPLRLLHCTQPLGQSYATCTCQGNGLIWDPKATRINPDILKDTMSRSKLKKVKEEDDESILGSCRLQYSEECSHDDECATNLKCLEINDETICIREGTQQYELNRRTLDPKRKLKRPKQGVRRKSRLPNIHGRRAHGKTRRE